MKFYRNKRAAHIASLRKSSVFILLFFIASCANDSASSTKSDSSAKDNSSSTPVTGAAAKGCQSSQAAFHLKNDGDDSSTFSISAAANCLGTNYPTTAATLAKNEHSTYVCVPTGTYYAKRDLQCSGDSFTFTANKVYKITVEFIFDTVIASGAEE